MSNTDSSRGTPNKPSVLREFEFYGGCIRVKISVKNTSDLAILDAALDLEADEQVLHFDRCEPEYPEKKGKLLLGSIYPDTDRTIAFYLDPLICAKEGTDINCRIFFKDAFGRSDMVQMEPLKIKVICPIFRTEHDINIGRLKELISELQFHDSKVYTLPKRVELTELLRTCRDAVMLHDVRHIKTFKTTDERTYESWYYGKTKVTKKDLVIKCCVRRETESIEVFAAGNDPSDITGLLAEIGRNLAREFERLGKVQPVFNITIKDSIIQRSNLLSFCDLDGTCGGNVVIEDSVVQRTNIASWNETAQKEGEDERLRKEKEEQEKLRREEEERQRIEEEQRREEERRELERAENKEREKQEQTERWRKQKEEQERLRRQKEQEDRALRERKALEEAERRESERQKARQEEERIAKEREELSNVEKKTGSSQIKFLAVALLLGVLLIGYWVLAPGPTKSTPFPFPDPPIGQNTFTNSIGMEFVQIPAGEFDMVSPSKEEGRNDYEGPVHRVKIANAFYMGKYEVTQKQWREVMGNNLCFSCVAVSIIQWRDVMGNNPSNFKGDNLPVEEVSWDDVQEFIKKLNEEEGTDKYRLPSEAEWEYAARAGTTTRYSFGDDESKLGDYAWYGANSDSKTHEVGQKKPNPWGLYDIHGNVYEWVQDSWHDNYNGAPTNGSAWDGDGSDRVVRGGNFYGNARFSLSAIRGGIAQGGGTWDLGFRLVRSS